MAIVEVENLSRTFGTMKALDGLTFSVEEGEIFGLVGPDGSGKTTCLRILCGLMRPTAGKAFVLGRNVAADPEDVKPDIGYMAQPAGLYEDLTVSENVSFYADLYEVPQSQYVQRMRRLLAFSGLEPFTDRLFRHLSGGMKQKVGLTCALIHTPKVLFLDEPTNGVDPVSRRDFWKILYELRREKVTIVVASTYLDEADRCHRIAVFDQGRVRLVMEPQAMRRLLRGQLFNLTVSERRKALKYLKTETQVLNPSIFGAGIHFSLSDEADLDRVKAGLASIGLSSFHVERIQPSLEDVYLSLVEEKGGGEGQ
ncbi:MAG: ABC transporter ATP-binding protein [Desulfobacteraceae bacterium]|jgi:ABC-2 type transport system ATP-binding protein